MASTTVKKTKSGKPPGKRPREYWLEDTEERDEREERLAAAEDELDSASDLEGFIVNDAEYDTEGSGVEGSEAEEKADDLTGMSIDVANLPAKRTRRQTKVYVHPFQNEMDRRYEEQKRKRAEKKALQKQAQLRSVASTQSNPTTQSNTAANTPSINAQSGTETTLPPTPATPSEISITSELEDEDLGELEEDIDEEEEEEGDAEDIEEGEEEEGVEEEDAEDDDPDYVPSGEDDEAEEEDETKEGEVEEMEDEDEVKEADDEEQPKQSKSKKRKHAGPD
jgi:hypothetical protein